MKIESCRVCESKDLELVLDLGNQPWCNDYKADLVKEEEKYPLKAVFCNQCTTFQIDENVDPSIMYGNHTYRSASNTSMLDHFELVALKASKIMNIQNGAVVDIGSNDGTLLSCYKKLGWDVFGFEPSINTSVAANANGINTLNEFFNYETVKKFKNQHNIDIDIISAANVLYHIEDIHGVLKGVEHLLSKNGIFVIQASYLPSIVENNEFDIIYHEHLLYYRIGTLNYLLEGYGLEIFDCDFHNVHGGSVVAYASRKGVRPIENKVINSLKYEDEKGYSSLAIYKNFALRVNEIISSLRTLIREKITEGCSIYAYGAPAKGTVLINALGLSSKEIKLAVEVNDQKFNTFIPGTNIPVVDERTVDIEPDYYLLLSWNFLDHFTKSEKFKNGDRKFIVPFPYPRVVSSK